MQIKYSTLKKNYSSILDLLNTTISKSFTTFLLKFNIFIILIVSKADIKRKKTSEILKSFSWSGYQDSNLGPPAPKAGALTGLRYIPYFSQLRCKDSTLF